MVDVNRDWLTKEEAEAFIGENSYYYLDKWKTHANSTLKGWNWAAMFLGITWMAYRRMYQEILICLAILFALVFGIDAILLVFGTELDERIINFAFQLFLGFFGNMLYRKKALRTLKKSQGLDDSARIRFFAANGGVSKTAVVVCIILNVAVAFLPLMIYLILYLML